jgi:hypothetical protein
VKRRLQVRRRKISSGFNALAPESNPDFVTILPAEAAAQQHGVGKPAYAAAAWAYSKASDMFVRIELRCVTAGERISMT